MGEQIGGVMCDPNGGPSDDPNGGCREVPADPSACESIIAPLREGQDVSPEDAQGLIEAFDACMQSQPLVTVCDDSQGTPPPLPPSGDAQSLGPDSLP